MTNKQSLSSYYQKQKMSNFFDISLLRSFVVDRGLLHSLCSLVFPYARRGSLYKEQQRAKVDKSTSFLFPAEPYASKFATAPQQTKKVSNFRHLIACLFFVVDRGFELMFCIVLICFDNQLNNT